jgi:uncharacterized protein (TIGR02145 family)
MKKNLFYAVLFFTVSFASCKKDNNNENESQGTIQFGLSVPKQQTKQENMSTSEVPASIVITIADSKGKVVIESKKIVLFNMNGSYISESLSLVIGNYNITKFLVLNNSDSVIYATPLKGSNLAYLVTTPLPIAFNISKNNVTEVVPEVLSVESLAPEDFGYYSFSFDVVKTFDFLVTIMVYNFNIKNWELTTANIVIRAADSTIAYSGTLADITNQITLCDNSISYTLQVSKVGYQIYSAIFTADELKLYFKSEDKGPLIIRLSSVNSESVTDIDGNIYHTVVIGTQVWMAENLKTTEYRNGDLIGTTTPATLDISGESTPKFQWAFGGNESNVAINGRLYTWYAATDNRIICPTSWHVPTDAEWVILTDYLTNNGYGYQGSGNDIAKSMAATSSWIIAQTSGTPGKDQASNNSSGFNAFPSGNRYIDGQFGSIGYSGTWWNSTENSLTTAYKRQIDGNYSNVRRFDDGKQNGLSVRCVKDN